MQCLIWLFSVVPKLHGLLLLLLLLLSSSSSSSSCYWLFYTAIETADVTQSCCQIMQQDDYK